MNTKPALPAHITAAIDSLVRVLRSGGAVNETELTGALESLVHAGVTLAEQRQTATTRPGHLGQQQPGLEVRSGLPAETRDAGLMPPCGAVFTRVPRDARDARTTAPCDLAHGHTGPHANSRGVTWTRDDAPRQKNTPTPRRSTTVTTSSTQTLKARHAALQARMNTPSPQPAPRTTRRSHAPAGVLDRAAEALRLAQPPQWVGWLPSQRRTVLERLHRTGTDLLQYALDHRTSHASQRHEIGTLRRRLVDLSGFLTPGATADVRQDDLDALTKAITDLHEPFRAQKRMRDLEADQFARRRKALDAPRRSEPKHPWFDGNAA